jgi:hypothetical protein
MFRKKSKKDSKRSKTDLRDVLKKHRDGEEDANFEYEEVTDIIDLSLEMAKRGAERAQQKAKSTIDTLKKISDSTPPPKASEGHR